jgi:hypothetical protein
MADRTISNLVEVVTPATNDVIPIVNAATTKKVRLDNLVKSSSFSNFSIRNLSDLDTSTPSNKYIPVQSSDSTLGRVSVQSLYPVTSSSSNINLNFNNSTRILQASIVPGSFTTNLFSTQVVQTTAIADGAITEAKIDPNAKIGGATGGGTDRAFYVNDQNVNFNFEVPVGKNAMSAGPITIQNGATVTVPNSSVWTVV